MYRRTQNTTYHSIQCHIQYIHITTHNRRRQPSGQVDGLAHTKFSSHYDLHKSVKCQNNSKQVKK